MLKRESGVRKATGSYRTYSIPGKTTALVPEFAVEDLPSAELQPMFLRFQWRTCPWAEHSDDDNDDAIIVGLVIRVSDFVFFYLRVSGIIFNGRQELKVYNMI